MLINGRKIERPRSPQTYSDRELICRGWLTWKLYGKKIPVMTTKGVTPEYAKKCARALNGLSEETIDAICGGAKKYCLWYAKNMRRDINSIMRVPIFEDTPPREILADISPKRLAIAAPDSESVGFCVSFDCEWENWRDMYNPTPYGLCVAVLDGKAVFVGTDMIFFPGDKNLETFMNWADGFENFD